MREEEEQEIDGGAAVAYLEAVDREEAAEDALLEPRAQHDHVVLHVHGGRAASPVDREIEKRWRKGGRGRERGKCGSPTARVTYGRQRERGLVDRRHPGKAAELQREGVRAEWAAAIRHRLCHGSARKIAFLGLEANFLRTWHCGSP